MPIVARHHARDDWRPVLAWPDDTQVQWGGSGIVFRSPDRGGSYGTAFFEAFPAGGGFIRGEGDTVEEAEEQAFKTWRREEGCPGHRFGRGRHTNGGGTCRICGAFRGKVFKPLHVFGDWRKPLGAMERQAIGMGGCVPWRGDDADGRRYARRLWLRARRAGIDLPPAPAAADEAFNAACHAAVQAWLRPRLDRGASPETGDPDTIEGFLGRMALRGLGRTAPTESQA